MIYIIKGFRTIVFIFIVISVLLLTCSQDWISNLQMIVFLEA